MNRSFRPFTTARRVTVRLPALGALVAAALALGGCVSSGPERPDTSADGRPTEAQLNRVAASASTGGVVNVRFVDGVAYVNGHVTTAIEENAVVRALRNVEGVDRVESQVARNM